MTQANSPSSAFLTGELPYVLLLAAILALPVSFGLLRLYRRAVLRSMRAHADPRTSETADLAASTPPNGRTRAAHNPSGFDHDSSGTSPPTATVLYSELLRAPWRVAAIYAAAGVGYALTMATAALLSYRTEFLLLRLLVFFLVTPGAAGGIADLNRQRAATYPVTRARLRGYAGAIEGAGLSWADVPVRENFENAPEEGRKAAEALLSRDPRPTAILAISDQLALGVVEAARERGLRVPEDLSVVGFDDVPEAARSNPPLTTVHQPYVEKGLMAGRLLVAQLQGGETARSPALLPTSLIVRGSTARVGEHFA